jgi:hypothetical protein
VFSGWRALLALVRRPDSVVSAPFDPELRYPQPWSALKEADNPYTAHHHDRTGRLLDRLAPSIERNTERVARMRGFGRRQPAVVTPRGSVFPRREPGAAATELVFRGNDGVERVLADDFAPSLLHPDFTGYWVSPDGRYVAYSQSKAADEGGATLHVVRTDTGEAVCPPTPGALYTTGAWVEPSPGDPSAEAVFVYSTAARRSLYEDWTPYVRRFAADGTHRDAPLAVAPNAPAGTQYHFTAGPEPGTVTVLTCRHAINTPTGIEIVDVEQRGRGQEIQRESEGVLARVQVGPRRSDGTRQLFMMRLDPESGHRGRVVTVEAPAEPGGPPRFREVVAGQAGDILRDMVIVDRGPDQPPALALSVRRHGGEVRIDLVSLRETADGAATADHRWTVPLPDAQPITAADGSTQITGNYGLVTGLSATGGAGHGVLEIEYTSRESVPHRLYRLPTAEPGAAAVQAAGPTNEEARDAGIPAVDVTLHMAPGERDHSTPVFLIRRASAESGPGHEPPAKVPTIVWPYPFYFLGGPAGTFNPVTATLVDQGVAVVVPTVYGSGAHSFREQLGSRAEARLYAAEDVKATLDLLDTMPEYAGKGERIGFFQSASGMTGLDVLRHMADRFDSMVFNRPILTTLSTDNSQQLVHMDVSDPVDRRAGYAHSGGIAEEVRRPPRNLVFVLGTADPRIPDDSVRMTAAAFDEARAEHYGDKAKPGGGTWLIEQQGSGHFPGGNEQAVLSTFLGYLAGLNEAVAAPVNTGPLPRHPEVAAVPNHAPAISRARTAPNGTTTTAARLNEHNGPSAPEAATRGFAPVVDFAPPRSGETHANVALDQRIADRTASVERQVPALALHLNRTKHL